MISRKDLEVNLIIFHGRKIIKFAVKKKKKCIVLVIVLGELERIM